MVRMHTEALLQMFRHLREKPRDHVQEFVVKVKEHVPWAKDRSGCAHGTPGGGEGGSFPCVLRALVD